MFFELSEAENILKFYRDYIADASGADGRVPGVPDRAAAAVHPRGSARRHVHRVGRRAGPDPSSRARPRSSRSTTWRRSSPSTSGRLPYPALNSAFDALVPGRALQHYWKANFAKELTDEAIAAHVTHGSEVPVVNSTMHIYPINGAAQPRGLGRDGVRVPRCELRHGDRRRVARPRAERGEHEMGARLLRRHRPVLGGRRVHQLHVRRRPGTGSRRTTRATTSAWSTSSGSTTPTTCSTSTRTSSHERRHDGEERRARKRGTAAEIPLSAVGPTGSNTVGDTSEASTTSWVTSTSPGPACPEIRAAQLTVRPK